MIIPSNPVQGFRKAHGGFTQSFRVFHEEKAADMTEIYDFGKINIKMFEKRFEKIRTDEVIITDERKKHILLRHPEDYALFEQYGRICLADPDLIVSDEKRIGTVYMLKRIMDIHFNVVLRLALESDNEERKNSVMTFWRIRDKNVQKMIQKNEIIYKKE